MSHLPITLAQEAAMKRRPRIVFLYIVLKLRGFFKRKIPLEWDAELPTVGGQAA